MDKNKYLRRCFDLARKAGKEVKSNPKVGAVLVHKNKIIGEGFHAVYGGPHAEINCFNSVKEENHELIKESTLFLSLEPCCFEGKTPACTTRIISEKVKKVVFALEDPHDKVTGKSKKILEKAGILVEYGFMEEEAKTLIKEFSIQLKRRPYITLKWAQSKDQYIGLKSKQIWLSNSYSKIYAHKLRANVDAILIGTNTARIDNPSLTTRDYPGENPVRIVFDRTLTLNNELQIFADEHETWIINQSKNDLGGAKKFIKLDFEDDDFLNLLLNKMYTLGIHRLLIEGGAFTLKQFLKKELWDEAHVIQTKSLLHDGIKAPVAKGKLINKIPLIDDQILIINAQNSNS